MTTENDRPDDASSVIDPALSRVYRETRSETAPGHLDERVLAAARRAARPRYLLLPASWFRPLAWTATVGLCMAIAINLNTAPDEFSVPLVESEPNAKASGDPEAVGERLDTRLSTAAEQKRPGQAPATVAAPATPDEETARSVAAPSALAERADDRERAPDSADLASDAPRNERTAARVAGYAMSDADAVSREADDSVALCSAENLAAPDAWLRCIEALESEGRTEAAERERRRFEQKFPNYVVE